MKVLDILKLFFDSRIIWLNYLVDIFYIKSVNIKNAAAGNLISMFTFFRSLEEVNFINFNFEYKFNLLNVMY